MKLTPQLRKRVLLNITPLIDVLFILIIFFAVSSTFLEQPGIKLDLPRAKKPDLERVEKAVLAIGKDGQLYFRDKPITEEQLPELLRKAMQESQEKSLIIRADQEVHHGQVVRVMDIARRNGVRKLVISAEPER